MFGRTNDAKNAIITVESSPERTYASKTEASAAARSEYDQNEKMIKRVFANLKDGEGMYEAHS